MQSVRLPAEALTEIESIAREHDISIGALIRGWVLRSLAAERDLTLADAVDGLAADVDRRAAPRADTPPSTTAALISPGLSVSAM